MKYIVLLGDGMADWPIPKLDNKTILETANTPNMDWIASNGELRMIETVPEGMEPGSEVANMAIMGYNPLTDLTGRGALEALSSNVPLNPNEIAYRCNLITIEDGLIKDYSSGHIPTEESVVLIKAVQEGLKDEGVDFFPGIQYRHILRLHDSRFSEEVICEPPHNQLGKPFEEFLVKPKDMKDEKAVFTANYMNQLIEKSKEILINHPVNQKRKQEGKNMATNVWFWSGGKKPAIESFKEKYGLEGGVISAVDLIFGIGIAAGLQPIHVEGATGLLNTNYNGKVEAALNAIKENDFVYVHVEGPDEMGHAGDAKRKIQAVENFDSKIVGPILSALKDSSEEFRVAVLPDHPTPIKIRTHCREPVPVAIYDSSVKKDASANSTNNIRFTENFAKQSMLKQFADGEEFMKFFSQS